MKFVERFRSGVARRRRARLAEEQVRRDMIEMEAIVRASYRPNAGRVLPGEIPVIAPRAEDFPWEDNRDFYATDNRVVPFSPERERLLREDDVQ